MEQRSIENRTISPTQAQAKKLSVDYAPRRCVEELTTRFVIFYIDTVQTTRTTGRA